jgi:type VI secretion system protein ImpM
MPDGSVAGPAGAAPGWYGKLSTLGDFASRRLAPAQVQVLDRWLAAGIEHSRGALGDGWLPAYLASPLQRFVLGPGLLPQAPWAFGMMMASCDNVGRYFPLVVLQPRPAPPLERFGFDHLELWWQRVGEAMLETLADSVDVERFERVLAELPPWPAAREPLAWVGSLAGTTNFTLPAHTSPAELAQGLAAGQWLEHLRGASLWWSWRPQGGESRCRIVAGLPAGDEFGSLIG